MRLQIAKVLPLLALSFFMAEASASLVNSTAAAAAIPLSASAPNPATAVGYQSAWSGLIVARQRPSGLSGAGEASSWRPAAEIEPAPPAGPGKTSALMLSSLGMLGVISLLRLGRTL
ncbi:MAG TPA: hypothetical protein VJ572_04375 [Azonexus sp.]|nr:hypothetical protein [Azonexus sp.]